MKLRYEGHVLLGDVESPRIWTLRDANSPYNGSTISLETLKTLGYVR